MNIPEVGGTGNIQSLKRCQQAEGETYLGMDNNLEEKLLVADSSGYLKKKQTSTMNEIPEESGDSSTGRLSASGEKKFSYGHMWTNKPYVYMVLNLSFTYFLNTNIQFWMSDYLITINHLEKKTVVWAFTVVCITGPTLGAACSGVIAKHLKGGYESVNALPICILVSTILLLFCAPICFNQNEWLNFVLLWSIFFFGGILVPMITGICLAVVEPELRPQATALANMMYNMLGYCPAPVIYGWIQELTGGETSKWAMVFNFSLCVPATIFLCLALYYKPDLREYWTKKKEDYMQRKLELIQDDKSQSALDCER